MKLKRGKEKLAYSITEVCLRLVSPEDQQEAERRALAAAGVLDQLILAPTQEQRERLRLAGLNFVAWERLDDAPAVKALRKELNEFADASIEGIDIDCMVFELSDWGVRRSRIRACSQRMAPWVPISCGG